MTDERSSSSQCRRRETDLLHQLGGVGGEEDLVGDAGIIDIALDLAPALHLREDPAPQSDCHGNGSKSTRFGVA